MRIAKTTSRSCTSRAADPPFCHTSAGAISAARARRSRFRRLLRGAAVSVAALSLGLAWAVPAAQAAQRPAGAQVTSPILYKYTFSRIAWAGSDQVIAATDSHGDLYYFWQASGTTTWHKQLVAKGGTGIGYSKPSIAWTGQAVAIAALDSAGGLYYFAKAPTATTWTGYLLASSATKFQAPAITAGDGSVLITAGNTAGQLDSFTLASGNSTWAAATVAYGTFGPSSVTIVLDHSLYLGLVTASSGGSLYFWYEFLSTPGWIQETVAAAGAGGSYTGGSIMASASNLVIAAATGTGTVDAFTQPIGGSGWTQQTVASTGGPYASPQIAWTGPINATSASYDVITAANKAGALDFWWNPDGSTAAWNPETVAANGLSAVYANPGITVTSTSVVITAINTKPGNVMAWYQPFGTNPWNQQTVAKG